MEAILVMPSPDRGREFVLPLSLSGIRVRTVIGSGTQLLAELSREPADCIILPEQLPDGPAEEWLARVTAAGAPRRPLGVVLIYGVDGAEAVRDRVRGSYGPTVDVVQAGARPVDDVARDTGQVLERMARLMAEQDREAHERLRQPTAPSPVPAPVRRSGAIAFVGISGGVGTSTLVANLAAHAALLGQRVLVVDAQFATGGSVMHYLGGLADEATKGLHHLRWNYMTAAAAAQREAVGAELLARADEVRIRGARHGDLRVMQVPAILDQMLNMPAEQVVWGIRTAEEMVDLLLVDCGSGLGEPRTRKILEAASRIMLMTGGWGGSVHALARGLSAMDEQADRAALRQRCFLLLREGAEGAYGARTVRSAVQMPIYGRVPDEPLLRKADGQPGGRVPLVAEAPDSAYARAVAQVAYALGIAGDVPGAGGARGRRRGLFGFLRGGASQ